MSISATVRQCLARFKSIEGEYRDVLGLEDEHGRFRIWVGNISAHRSGGRRSLEYRLRDSSNLQSMVVALLQDLLKALDDLENAMKASLGALSEDTQGVSESNRSCSEEASDDEDDAAFFGLTIVDGCKNDASMRAMEEIHEVNLCLLRFSMTLRNPARHDEMKESTSTSTHHFERFDVDHVQNKFPGAQSYLHERLGKAISKHRQYFKYREGHHSKLAEGLDDEKVKDERPSTIATSLNVPATDIPTSKGDELETESLYTATSFAPTTAGDVTLRPPPLPEAGQDGAPFECPLCFGIVIAEDERSWRQHVYEDLPPYVCTYAACITANQRYSRRRDWQRHQASSHNRNWLCPYGCSKRFDSETEFQQHLIKKHHIDTQAMQQRFLETSAVASTDVADLTCPLCQTQLSSSKLWMKHLGHHLEQLALHALPQHVFTLDSDNESAATGKSAPSSGSSESNVDFDLEVPSKLDNSETAARIIPKDDDPDYIRFKDAVGRTHWLLWEVCKTWADMERQIIREFEHIDSLRNHVRDGHYDLLMPGGERILPPFWETTIQPTWEISMRMWPVAEKDLQRVKEAGEFSSGPGHDIVGTGPESERNNSDSEVERELKQLGVALDDGHRGAYYHQPFAVPASQSPGRVSPEREGSESRDTHEYRDDEVVVEEYHTDPEDLEDVLDFDEADDFTFGDDALPKSHSEDVAQVGKLQPISDSPEEARTKYLQRSVEVKQTAAESQIKTSVEFNMLAKVESFGSSTQGEPKTKKGKTRMPKRWVHREAILDLGYPFDDEHDCFVLRVALRKEGIDELIALSKPYKDQELHEDGPSSGAGKEFGDAEESQNERQDQDESRVIEDDEQSLSEDSENMDENEQARLRIRRQMREKNTEEHREWNEFLLKQKQNEEEEEAKIDDAEAELERERLAGVERTDDQIEKEQTTRTMATAPMSGNTDPGPIYPKIHVKYLSLDTLRYYEVPWEYDSYDSNYIIITREMDKYETEVLFEHTRVLRRNNPDGFLKEQQKWQHYSESPPPPPEDTPSQSYPETQQDSFSPMQQLHDLRETLAQFKGKCQSFLQDTSTPFSKAVEMQHKRLSEEGLTQVLLRLDSVETEGHLDARALRRQLVIDAESALRELDKALRSRPRAQDM